MPHTVLDALPPGTRLPAREPLSNRVDKSAGY